MIISYKVYLIIYSICTFVFMFIVLRHLDSETIKPLKRKNKRTNKWFILFLLLTISPQIFRVLLAYGSFLAPDLPVYMRDSALIIEKNHIPPPPELEEDPYYKTFPIFTLAISLTKIVTGFDFYMTFLIIDILVLVLFSTAFWGLLHGLFDLKTSFIGSILLSTVIVSNSYFYGLYNMVVPIFLGCTYLLLLLKISFTQSSSRSSLARALLFFLFAIMALVHVDLLVYAVIALAFLVAVNFFGDVDQAQQKRKIVGKIWLSFLIFVAYIGSSTVSLRTITFKFLLLFQFLSAFIKTPGLPGSGYAHPIPMLNALGPALQIGISGAYVTFTFIYSKVLRRKTTTYNSYILTFSSISILLLSLAFGWYFYGGQWGRGNVMSYFTTYGFFLTTISNAFIVITALPVLQSSRKKAGKILLLLLLSILVLATVGSILDPLTFNRFP